MPLFYDYDNLQALLGSEEILARDPSGGTANFIVDILIDYLLGRHTVLKNVQDSAYDGYLVVARSGAGKIMTQVQQNDLLIGRGAFFSGNVVIMAANQDNPTTDGHFSIFLLSGNAQTLSSFETFTATAAQTQFILTQSPNNVDVYVDRVYQLETVDYTLAGNTVTMTYGVDENSIVQIRKF